MAESNRLIAIILEVTDLERSAALYRDGFGLDMHRGDHEGEDRWTSGDHAALSWTDGAYLHFSLYQAKSEAHASGAQVGFQVDDIEAAHKRALAAGAVLIHGPRPEPWGETSRYYDFDGNIVGLTLSR